MLSQEFKNKAKRAGFSADLIADFEEDLQTSKYRNWASNPTIENLAEYQSDRDSAYGSQVCWDAQFHHDPINVGGYQGK